MAYDLKEINYRAKTDPAAFTRDCGLAYEEKVRKAADMIVDNLKNSPIVLLSGPSGSGKTTTSKKLEEELERRGIVTHALAMDCYFRDVDDSSPRTEDGEIDLESPLCLDMELLNRHFDMLSRGEEIQIPKYDFSRKRRAEEPWGSVRLGPKEVVVVEGIHALNDIITEAHPEAMRLYISARSNVEDEGKVVFKGTWMRLTRRTVRDSLFRGSPPEYTFSLWENIRRGEKAYISPFKDKAHMKFDSSLPCEVGIFKNAARELFKTIPPGTPRYEELRSIYPAFELFEAIDPELLGPESLLREFIGGGKYRY